MKRLLLGIIIASSVITISSQYIKHNYTPRINTSKSFKGELIHKKIKVIKLKTIKDITNDIKKERKEKEQQRKWEKELKQIKRVKIRKKKINKPNKIIHKQQVIKFTLTFYTALEDENGGYTITCTGDKLNYGMVASNVYPLGTKIYLEGYGVFTVADRGGSNFNDPTRLDVLIERKGGENNVTYTNRVNNMGKALVNGYIIK